MLNQEDTAKRPQPYSRVIGVRRRVALYHRGMALLQPYVILPSGMKECTGGIANTVESERRIHITSGPPSAYNI